MKATFDKPIKILLVDDHAAMRSGLHLLIESYSGFKVVAEVGNHAEALEATRRHQPDVILLDLSLGDDKSGLDVLSDLLSVGDQTRVLVLTGVRDVEMHNRAIHLGAKGLIMKERGSEELIKAIEKVHMGEVWFDRSTISRVLDEVIRPLAKHKIDPEAMKINSLTKRELEIVRLVGEGNKNKQIAERLFISETTVRHHLASIFSKLDVSDRLEVLIYANRHSLAKLS